MNARPAATSLLQTEAHRRGVLGLYRTILRLHRRRLPQSMRDLGDAFVSHEFKLHKEVKDEQVVAAFLSRWREYLGTLRAASGEDSIARGVSLGEDDLAAMSDDQRQQLNRLRMTLFEEDKKEQDKF